MGELLIDFISTKRGHSVGNAPAFVPVAGGAPANVAVGISKLITSGAGAKLKKPGIDVPSGKVGFIGKVGDDPFGRKLKITLGDYGIDTSAVSLSKKARTMLAFVSLTADGERDFVFFRHPSADMLITTDDVPANYLEDAFVFHFGSIGLTTSPSRDTTISLIHEAKRMGVVVSFDPNIRMTLWPDEATAKEEIRAAISLADIVKMSAEEARFITGVDDPKNAAKEILTMGPKLAAVTKGKDGSVSVTGRYGVEVLGFDVAISGKTGDTTGAGDAFTAAMLWMMSELNITDLDNFTDLEMIKIFRFANAAGAITTTRQGAIPALPTANEVKLLLKLDRGGKGEGFNA